MRYNSEKLLTLYTESKKCPENASNCISYFPEHSMNLERFLDTLTKTNFHMYLPSNFLIVMPKGEMK